MLQQALSFDDVLLVPQRTFGGSRGQVSLNTQVAGIFQGYPFLSANMSSITEVQMAIEMRNFGGIGVLHRMCSPKEQFNMVKELFDINIPVFVSIEGSYNKALERIKLLEPLCPRGYCVDVAHADSPDVENTIIEIYSKVIPTPRLIIGNYATPEGIGHLLKRLGNNFPLYDFSFKVGIGSGSQCTTRIVTGSGLPTLESLFRIRKLFPNINLIADGGIKNSGDIVKALAAGASSVMLGHVIAGCKETPGNVIKNNNKLFKIYRGSASFGQKFEVQKEGYVEGEETLVPYKGHVATILTQLVEGIRSGFSYNGALNIKELQENAEFVQISNSGFVEGTAHGA
jgi:IMP dehydrogenase